MTVYMDTFFMLNLIMDFLVLITASKLIKEKTSIKRILLAAVLGAVYSCVVIILNFMNGMIEMVVTYIVISIIMVLILYGYQGGARLFENVLSIYTVTFLVSGAANTLYYRKIVKGSGGLIAVGGLMSAAIVIASKISVKKRSRKADFVTVKVVKGEQSVTVMALIDTGNSLIEPITRKPVAVISKNVTEIFAKGDDGVFVIPYKSVGREHGMLQGFMADYIVITKDNQKEKVITKPIIAEYDGSFTNNNSYQMLLNPQMAEQGEEKNDCKNESKKQNVF